ncbi:MAG: hypothetical protein PHY05_10205 [Methanothrix sp.]|nr:hypothetical protein [Methanothrix sp.]
MLTLLAGGLTGQRLWGEACRLSIGPSVTSMALPWRHADAHLDAGARMDDGAAVGLASAALSRWPGISED